MVRHARARALGMALAAPLGPLAGCQSATADVLAVWIDAAVDDDGARAIQIYEGGDRRRVVLRPTIADSDTSQLSLGVAPGGAGFAVSSIKGGTVWVDLHRGTRGQIAAGPWGELRADFAFSRSGRAILRDVDSVDDGGSVLLPIATGRAVPLWLEPPAVEHEGAFGLVRSAADAPVVYWAEQALDTGAGAPARIDGTVVAYAYPSEDPRDDELDRLVALGDTRMHTRAIDAEVFTNRIGRNSGWCSSSFCVTPEGDAAIGIAPAPCQLLRFEWARTGSDGDSRPAREIDLPAGCGTSVSEPHLLAAFDADHVLLDDDERLYVADLARGTWRSLPKLGAASQIYMLPADGGRTMLLVSVTGAVMRADASGLEVVSAERAPCGISGGPTVSPGGEWVLLTCLGDPSGLITEIPSEVGTTLRISSLGLERYDGIAMLPLGIDDGGNALLFSYDPDDNERVPRGLFVLEGNGRLARVDELEPTPEVFRSPSGNAVYFSATPRVP